MAGKPRRPALLRRTGTPPKAGKYVTVRGLEPRAIFRDARGRADFTARVAAALGMRQMAVLRGVLRGRALLRARRLDPERLPREAVQSTC
jgi:hypothetical protein